MAMAGEDDTLHVSADPDGRIAAQQAAMAARLEKIDRWGKILTIVVVVYGLVLGAAFLYQEFTATGVAEMG